MDDVRSLHWIEMGDHLCPVARVLMAQWIKPRWEDRTSEVSLISEKWSTSGRFCVGFSREISLLLKHGNTSQFFNNSTCETRFVAAHMILQVKDRTCCNVRLSTVCAHMSACVSFQI